MNLRITLASGEVEDFALEMLIDANASFLDLHKLILKACHYEEGEKHRFYICDEDWRPEQRILLHDEGITNSDEDLYLMEDTILGDFLEDEGQRFAYRFDPESRRLFLLELTETSFGDRLDKAAIKRRVGVPPAQSLEEEEPVAVATNNNIAPELDESFYGDEGFEADEFDEEGFDIID